MKNNLLIIWTIILLAPLTASAQDSALNIPDEVKVFVEQDTTAIAFEAADLNGDGTKDYILVTEKTKPQPTDDDADDLRSLLILTRDKADKLTLAKRNEKVVYCRSCGGACGGAFDSIEAKRNGFTVYNYGGSAWRWGEHYQFNYSRIDKTWQLVRAEEILYNSLDPEKTTKTKILTPKKFGSVLYLWC